MAAIDDQFNQWLSQQESNWAIQGLGGADPSQINQLKTYWATLSPTLKASFLQTLQRFVQTPEQLTQVNMQKNPAVQPSTTYSAPSAAPATNSATGVQAQAVTAATAATAALPDQTVGDVAPGIPVVGAAGATIPGTSTPSDFNDLLNNYYQQEIQQAGGNINSLATVAGMTPQNLQSQYNAYTQGLQKAFAGAPQGAGAYTPLSLEQFATQKAQSMVGPWAAVLASISGIWESQYQQALPADLATQIISALNQMPQAQQSNVLYEAYQYMTNAASAAANKGLFDQTGSYATAILSALPSSILTYTAGSGTGTGSLGTEGIVGTYAQVHPSAFLEGETIQATIAADFQKALNRAPTAADLAALGTDPTPAAIQQYIDNQPMPGMNMTYGAYTQASGALTPLWEEYFGKDPTPAELAWAVGKSPEDIQSFINNSQSSIPGVTIGEKNDYESFIDGFDKSATDSAGHVYGLSAQIDDSLISSLHQQITKASTGVTKPGKM
jgi:hypothetical protein